MNAASEIERRQAERRSIVRRAIDFHEECCTDEHCAARRKALAERRQSDRRTALDPVLDDAALDSTDRRYDREDQS